MRARLLIALALSTMGCAGSTAVATGESIIDGTENPGDPSIVAIGVQFQAGGALCTASLISPRVIVTAKHCICDTDTGAPVRASAVQVRVGASFDSGRRYSAVSEVRTTP